MEESEDICCRKIWLEYQREGLFTDVSIKCMDGATQIHRIMLLELIPCLHDENSDLIILPEVSLSAIEDALSKLYRDLDGDTLCELVWGPGYVDFFKQQNYSRIQYLLPQNNENLTTKVNESPLFEADSGQELDETNHDSAIDEEIFYVEEIKEEEEILLKKCDGDESLLDLDYSFKDEERRQVENEDVLSQQRRRKKRRKGKTLRDKIDPCDLCGEMFSTKRSFKEHWRTIHEGTEPPRYKCDDCELTFTFTSNLRRHIRIQHILKKGKVKKSKVEGKCERIQCHQCGKWFNWLQNLMRHERIVHSGSLAGHQRGLRCDACNLDFTRSDNLKRHMQKYHLGNKPGLKHKCDLCELQFRSKTRLFEHQKLVHDSSGVGLNINIDIKKEYNCPKCGQIFKRRSTLKEHMSHEHNIGAFYCEICDISLKTKDSLKYHKTKHNPKFSCDVCGKQIETQAKLNDHLNIHTGARPYKCSTIGCGKTFTARGQLYHHIKKCQTIMVQPVLSVPVGM